MTDQPNDSKQPLSRNSLVRQQFFPPQPFHAASALGLLRHWAAESHAPQLILETRSDVTGVEYFIGSQLRHAPAVRRVVEQLVRGAVVTGSDPDEMLTLTTARRISLSTMSRPLEPSDALASERSILHALTAVGRNEHLVLQIVLGPRRPPRLPPREVKRADQSMLSKVLHGVTAEQQGDARQALAKKLGQHGFAATVRIGVEAPTAERRRTLLLGLAAAITTVEAPGVHLRLHREKPTKISNPRSTWSGLSPSTHLTVSEVAHLSGWPITDDDEPLPGQPPKHPRPVRPTAAVLTGERIIADANAPGVTGTIGYNMIDACRHSWILGPNGTGKSTLLLWLIIQDLQAGRPVIVIEPKDLVADLLARIPESRWDDVAVMDLWSQSPISMNPLDARHRYGRSPEVVADGIFAALKARFGDSLGPRSSDILRNCLEVLARRNDASLVMLPLLLTNPGFRRSVTQQVIRDDPFAAGPFWQWFNSLSPETAASVVAPLSNKLRPMLSKPLRNVLAQREPKFNIRQVLKEKKVLLVPLQKGIIGPEAAELLASIVMAELWQALRERAGSPEESRDPVAVYIDEVQDYLRLPTDLGDALATARSLKGAFHLAHQFEMQLPPAMLNAVRSNARSRIAFQLPIADARNMASGQSVLTAEDFTSLPAHHIYASVVRDNTIQPWASGITRPAPPITSNPDDIRRRSEANYGQPLNEVEAGFAALLDDLSGTADGSDIGAPRRRRNSP